MTSFTEVDLIGTRPISNNSQSRAGTVIDCFLGHTVEGTMDELDLVAFMENNQVSYHYVITNDSNGPTTVYDCVNTDLASWSVLDANNRAINYVIGGSTVNWTTAEWMSNASNAIDVMAYLMVRDAERYGQTAAQVAMPPYFIDPPVFSDHKYVTEYLHIGTHTDLGPNFPWPYLTQCILNYYTTDPIGALMATNQEKLDLIYNKMNAYADNGDIPGVTQAGKWVSRARYAPDPNAGIDDTVGMMLYTDGNGFDLMVEFAASQGYEPAKQLIAARAKAHPEDAQAVFYAKKYPA